MKSFRIVKEEASSQSFIVQKRMLGFLWWYDIARFYTLDGARELLRVVYNKTKRIIIEEF